ncbi:uncharacterized protein LOC106160934 [Lingula anatina]|uniref:L-serine deaminase n=1 Tax=Lingula anatina TaxID=7574 RepID=A0A1S3I4K2_LINAN|nr:uncharacterized protein LOC106160934 [Lingula anatina]|eukprot:XP_013393192.1 uncharacterized protein LOC106160934 [Lingula anatina]
MSLAVPLKDIQRAQTTLKGTAFRTPLVPLNYSASEAIKIYLKLENLQPIGSFKLRGAYNAINCIPHEKLSNGVYTASAGNFAQGLSWGAKQMKIPCNTIVPDHAPQTKLDAIERLGGKYCKVPFNTWWTVIQEHHCDGVAGTFIHPVCEKTVMAGNGTIGLEILEDLPEVDAVIMPFGGGGLSCGIASAFHALKPSARMYACEVETAAPLAESFKIQKPTSCDYKASFVDGMGGKSVLDEMWPMVKELLIDSLVVSLQEVADAVKLLVERNRVVAEGAGAAPVAAALAGKAGTGNIVCVISGGNIDTDKLIPILQGKVPVK